MNGQNSIRDFIAFPKNNQGRDMMIEAPSPVADEQLNELRLIIKPE
jgi:aspartyl-tRNA synthetase